jgi:hypothetical protein
MGRCPGFLTQYNKGKNSFIETITHGLEPIALIIRPIMRPAWLSYWS